MSVNTFADCTYQIDLQIGGLGYKYEDAEQFGVMVTNNGENSHVRE